MFCPHCGYNINVAFSFCPSCGKKKPQVNVANGDQVPASARPVEQGQAQSEAGAAAASSSSLSSNLTSRPSANTSSSTSSARRPASAAFSFEAFRREKEAERRSHFEPKAKKRATATRNEDKGKGQANNNEVIITIGLMEYDGGETRPQRGKSFPVKLDKECKYDEALEKSLLKWETYDRNFSRERGYVLVYPDARQ